MDTRKIADDEESSVSPPTEAVVASRTVRLYNVLRSYIRLQSCRVIKAHQAAETQMGMKSGMSARIRDVWATNLEQEMSVLRQLIQKYPYVSMVCMSE